MKRVFYTSEWHSFTFLTLEYSGNFLFSCLTFYTVFYSATQDKVLIIPIMEHVFYTSEWHSFTFLTLKYAENFLFLCLTFYTVFYSVTQDKVLTIPKKKKCSGPHKQNIKKLLLRLCTLSSGILCEFYCFYVEAFLASISATVLTCWCSLLTPTSVLHHSWQFISVQDGWCSSSYCSPVSYFSPIAAHVPLFFLQEHFKKYTNNILENLFLCTAPIIRHSERIPCWR